MTRSRELRLVTPEGVPLVFELADLFERTMAFLLDIAIQGLALFALALIGITLMPVLADQSLALMFLGVFVVRHFYFVFFEVRWSGATPAKRLLRLRVIARDGGGLPAEAVFARNLLRDVELFIPIVALSMPAALVGRSPWWMWLPALSWVLVVSSLPLMTPQRQRAGDIVGDTVVVRVPRVELQLDEAAPRSQQSQSIRLTPKQLSVYGEHELETLAEILRQVDDGKTESGEVEVVARTIAKKVGYRGPEPVRDPVRFLRAFYRAQRAALEKQLLLGKRKADKFDES